MAFGVPIKVGWHWYMFSVLSMFTLDSESTAKSHNKASLDKIDMTLC